MDLRLRLTATVAKSFAIKRQKDDSDNERVIAHLKVHSIVIPRETFDELAGVPIGWCTPWYRETGDPWVQMSVLLITRKLYVTGKIELRKADTSERGAIAKLDLVKAEFTDLRFSLDRLGGDLSGELVWIAAGDEGEPIEDLLGQECAINWTVTDWIEEGADGQRDMIPPTPLERAALDDTTVRITNEDGSLDTGEVPMSAIRKGNAAAKKRRRK